MLQKLKFYNILTMTPIQTKFKQTEIWLIPEDWEVVELREIANFNQWLQVWLEDQFLEKKERMKRFIRIVDFTKDWEEPIRYIENKNWNFHVETKDLIMIRYWSQTAWKVIRWFEWIIANNMFKLNFTKWNLDYLYYYLSSESVYNNLVWWQNSSTMPAISFWYVWKLKLPLPPLPEQKAIAEILSSLDDKIELLEKQNKTLENIGQALFKAWFVDFEGFQDDLVESEMGMIPRGWKVGKLGDILETIESWKRPKWWIDNNLKEWIPSIWAENIIWLWNFEYWKNKLITREFFETMKTWVIQDYDVLLYKDWASLWRSSMFWKWFPYKEFCINEHVFLLRTNQKLNQFYLFFWTTIQENKQAIINLNSNAAQPWINQTSVWSLQIIIPELEILKKYEFIAKNNVDKIFENCLQIQTLSNLRDSLLPRLMSGKMRVV